jgi:hypothetical protein
MKTNKKKSFDEKSIFKFFIEELKYRIGKFSIRFEGGTYSQMFEINQSNIINDSNNNILNSERENIYKNIFSHGISGNDDKRFIVNLNIKDELFLYQLLFML